MARIHAHRKGRSGSTRPVRAKAPAWSPLNGKEVENQVVALAREGKAPAVIGMYLRDQFGVPNVREATGKKLGAILAENKLQGNLPPDIQSMLKTIVSIQDHLARTKNDLHNLRALTLVESKVRRLAKYYIREGKLPATWKYERDTVKLLLG